MIHAVRSAAMVLALAIFSPVVSGGEALEPLWDHNRLCASAALIAHVRIAGELPASDSGDAERRWLAEVVDAALGPTAGELVILAVEPADDLARHYRPGASLLLWATRDHDGTFRPLAGDAGCWPIDRRGQLPHHRYQALLTPSQVTGLPADVITWWKSEARQHAFVVNLAINERDLRDYTPERPLRLTVTIDNTGEMPLELNNHIEFVFHEPRSERLKETRRLLRSSVTICVTPLSRQRSLFDIQQQLVADMDFSLASGQRCSGEFDLAQEPQIYGGMRYQVWAEVGGRVSAPLVIELPGDGMELVALEKLAELDDGGPLRIVERPQDADATMPAVQPTDEAHAIDAALGAWWKTIAALETAVVPDDTRGEIILLSRACLPTEFASSTGPARFLVADAYFRQLDVSQRITPRDGNWSFGGRAVQVENVVLEAQSAKVVLREIAGKRKGRCVIIHVRRGPRAWEVEGEAALAE